MRLEVVLPNESPVMPTAALIDIVHRAEDLGFVTAYLPDHVLPPGEYGATFGGVYEPLVTLSYLAGITETVNLGTSVLILPLRNPFVLAKQVATAQHLSKGRLVLGVGTGWSEEEFAATGAEFRRRGRDTNEVLALMRHLITGPANRDRGPYDGGRFGFDHGYFAPVPEQQPAIMVGGMSDAALRRAATYADRWQGLPSSPDAYAARVAALEELSADRQVLPGVRVQWDDDRPVGTVVDEIRAYAAAGAVDVAVHFGQSVDYPTRMSELAVAFT